MRAFDKSINNELQFLVDTAVENGLQFFINDQNDLEIKDNMEQLSLVNFSY